jgi:hypothetical protein
MWRSYHVLDVEKKKKSTWWSHHILILIRGLGQWFLEVEENLGTWWSYHVLGLRNLGKKATQS